MPAQPHCGWRTTRLAVLRRLVLVSLRMGQRVREARRLARLATSDPRRVRFSKVEVS